MTSADNPAAMQSFSMSPYGGDEFDFFFWSIAAAPRLAAEIENRQAVKKAGILVFGWSPVVPQCGPRYNRGRPARVWRFGSATAQRRLDRQVVTLQAHHL
jgi:hypothetical protein